MELLERFLGDDDDAEGGSADAGDDDMLFEDDDLGGDDGLDDFDDGLGFEEDDDGGAATAELEGRIDEMENEVASLSSTVSTIRSENEEISNTVEDIEENVRKLLDIYEMVTRGVNPFVDDAQGAGADFDGGGAGESLGLFDGDDGDQDEEEDLDEDIAGAEAEEFFDEDFLDEDDEDDAFEEPTDDEPTTEDTMADDSDDSGKSFDELKDEYESGDADWGGGESGDATNGDVDEEAFADAVEDDAFDDEIGDADEEFADADDGFPDEDEFGGTAAADDAAAAEEPADATDDRGVAATAESGGGAATASRDRQPRANPDAADGAGDLQFAANTLMDSGSATTKPYLERLPAGYVGDLLVMEWLEYLVEEGDVNDAAQAVEYYRRIQWVGEDAADELHDFLVGFGEVDEDVGGAPSSLSIDNHVSSLRYVSRLTGSTADSVVFECWSGGGGVPFGL